MPILLPGAILSSRLVQKRPVRSNAMRYVLHAMPYADKDVKRIGMVDDLLVGRANIIHEREEHDLANGRYAQHK